LLPGSYRVIITLDGKPYFYGLEIPGEQQIGEIQRADSGSDVSGRETPFEFDGRQLELNPNGGIAVVALPHPGRVTWMIRQGAGVVWRGFSDGQQIASVVLPTGALSAGNLSSGVESGTYRIEALIGNSSTSALLTMGKDESKSSDATVVSFNANLSPARRFAFVGHQWLLRGRPAEARRSLQASLAKGVTEEALVELARADALDGNLDEARDQIRRVLALEPNNFEALSVFAYIEARFQDYAVAAQLYRQALAVQDSPALRAALAELPAAN
jgi:hypothetical protein